MKTTFCFGEALIDFHAAAPDEAHQPAVYTPHAGGAPANVAVAVAKLGGHALFAGMFGRDAFGTFLLESLRKAGVDIRYTRSTAEANTALAFVSLDASGERSFSFYRPPAADLLFRVEDFEPQAFRDSTIFHVCSNSLTEPEIANTTLTGMMRARESGTLVSFDMNLRPALWQKHQDPLPRVWAALEAADIVKLSAEEFAFVADSAGGEEAVCNRLWASYADWLVVTDGASPVRWFTPSSHGTFQPFVMQAIDTTGAGDAFVGGLLHALIEDGATADTLATLVANHARREAVLRFASACGALAVTRKGSFAAMPCAKMVSDFLDAQ